MSTTLKIPSFNSNNLRERTELSQVAPVGSSTLKVRSTAGIAADDIVYLGTLSREGCERAQILSVVDATTFQLVAATTLEHIAFEGVQAVIGDLIHVYRAPKNAADDQVPPDSAFSVLATRTIDPDQESSWYTDSSGSSAFWYRFTNFNAVTNAETSLGDSNPVRGDDFGHYAGLDAIRSKAGFSNSTRLSDVVVDQNRRIAESEVNGTLGAYMVVPFVKPVPSIIETVTILLAAGFLKNDAYGAQSKEGDMFIKDARAMLKDIASGATSTGDPLNPAGSGVIASFGDDDINDDGERLFSVGDIY